MTDIYENSQKDPELRDEWIEQRATDKFMALPDVYTRPDAKYQYSNFDDAISGLNHKEGIAIARALRDGNYQLAGERLLNAMMRIFTNEATDEWDENHG